MNGFVRACEAIVGWWLFAGAWPWTARDVEDAGLIPWYAIAPISFVFLPVALPVALWANRGRP